ncbi:transmembrane protease serine 6-like [Tetranychus urticae]|uniref:Peptidase S1 domain-containing protein n=1 Tax=Tetranychus urticae TaxID=32264 RepID=T1KP28_TETUR|nr:transmembrane protease serine 6-like [Tetranychus urticae]
MSLTLFASIFALLINQSFACDCGQPIGYAPPEESEGKLTRFPWYVVVENKNLKPCGAALIDDQHAAIAAHCLSGSNAASLRARLNDNSTKSVSSFWIDERYNTKTGAYDFAVLTLDSPVDSQFKPICLRDSDKMPMPAVHMISPSSGKNKEDYLYTNQDSKCPVPATKTHLCIMNPTKVDTCPEGPYMRGEANARYYLAGVTSRCFSAGKPDLFTDASLYIKKMRELAPKGCWKDTWDWSR